MLTSELKIAWLITIGTYLIILSISLVFFYNPPEKINKAYGYRTKKSMRNEKNWKYANWLSARLMLIVPQVFIVLLCAVLYLLHSRISLISFVFCYSLLLVLLLLSIIPITEHYLGIFEEKESE